MNIATLFANFFTFGQYGRARAAEILLATVRSEKSAADRQNAEKVKELEYQLQLSEAKIFAAQNGMNLYLVSGAYQSLFSRSSPEIFQKTLVTEASEEEALADFKANHRSGAFAIYGNVKIETLYTPPEDHPLKLLRDQMHAAEDEAHDAAIRLKAKEEGKVAYYTRDEATGRTRLALADTVEEAAKLVFAGSNVEIINIRA